MHAVNVLGNLVNIVKLGQLNFSVLKQLHVSDNVVVQGSLVLNTGFSLLMSHITWSIATLLDKAKITSST